MKELRCCVMIDTLYHKWLFLTSTSTHTYSLLEDDESLGVMVSVRARLPRLVILALIIGVAICMLESGERK